MMRSLKFLIIGMLVFQTSLFLWVGAGECTDGDVGADELRQKIDALKNLQEKVTDCIDTALAVRAELTAQGREFAGEIKDVHQHHRYGSYAEAVRNPRVHYNLKLIQMVSGYTGALDEKIVFFEDSLEQIRFLYRQADDELKMLQTLGSLDNPSLSERIERLLVDYRAELKKDLLVPSRISFRPCDAIWREIIGNSL
jgi:hypothetical protein